MVAVIPGRAKGANPESITTVLRDVLHVSPREWKTWHSLSGCDEDVVRRVYEHKSKVNPGFT
jgi:hypothetical protein